MTQTNQCPCGSTLTYKECCGKYHRGLSTGKNAGANTLPDSPETLMRSRYSAFALGEIDYLINTLHASKGKPDDADSLETAIESTQWLRLHILNHSQSDKAGVVEFQAIFRDRNTGEIGMLHEQSNFVKEDSRWFYTDGELFDSPIPKEYFPGRNDACWCGSGKKFKKCCGS
ncbi:MAG: YchJ family protein [Cellvibrionaceae bacterium]